MFHVAVETMRAMHTRIEFKDIRSAGLLALFPTVSWGFLLSL